MIVRAESDSESDDEQRAVQSQLSSIFDHPETLISSTTGNAARYLWFAGCATLVLLLLVDMAAINDPSDVFALLPLLLSTVYYDRNFIPNLPASMLNQFVGFALVSGWIYTRENSLSAGRSTQWLRGNRYGLWTVGALLLLGHVVTCFYVLFALFESNGDRTKFWLGRKHSRCNMSFFGRA